LLDLEQYKLIVESSPNMIWRSNTTAECDYFNKTWMDFTGKTLEEEYGYGWAKGVHKDDLDRCVKIYMDHFKKREKFEMDYRLMRKDGEYRWINDRGVPFFSSTGDFLGFIGSCMDVTEKIEGQMLKEMAQNDSLCNTYNRQYSQQLLEYEFGLAMKNSLPLSILMLDIDDFKSINDRYGHAAGDAVLKAVANTIKKVIRESDILGRYGGDEFVVGLVRINCQDAILLARRICIAVANTEKMVPDFPRAEVSVSIGVKCLENEQTLEELIRSADRKLYEAKKEGKNIAKG